MVLHIRVWESSSMPGFFLPKIWAKKHVILLDHASYSAAVLHIFRKEKASCTAGALHKNFLISDFFPESGFFCLEISRDDGTAHLSVGENV